MKLPVPTDLGNDSALHGGSATDGVTLNVAPSILCLPVRLNHSYQVFFLSTRSVLNTSLLTVANLFRPPNTEHPDHTLATHGFKNHAMIYPGASHPVDQAALALHGGYIHLWADAITAPGGTCLSSSYHAMSRN